MTNNNDIILFVSIKDIYFSPKFKHQDKKYTVMLRNPNNSCEYF